jgi:hypothetical protein
MTNEYELIQDTDLAFFKLQNKHHLLFKRMSFRSLETGRFTQSVSMLNDLAIDDPQTLDNLIKLAENLLADYQEIKARIHA